eukprot:362259_1
MYLNGKVKNNLEFLVFEFSRIQLNELKKEFLDEIKKNIGENISFLRSYEVIMGLFTEKIATYTTKTQSFDATLHTFNVRNRVNGINYNHISGYLTTMLYNDHTDIINSKKYNKYSLALNTHKMFNFCIQNKDEISNRYTEIRNNQIIGNLFFNKSYKYRMGFNRMEHVAGHYFLWNESKSFYNNNSFDLGTKHSPLHFYKSPPFKGWGLIAEAPNNGIRVYISMTKNNADKFKKNEEKFFEKYDISDEPLKHIDTNNSN